MPEIRKIDNFMSEWAKKEYSEPWDNDGVMLCENLSENVKNILVCLEINEKICDEAKAVGAQLIVTHHPYIFKGLKRISGNDYKVAKKLIENGISVLSYHTRLDCAQGGVNDVLTKTLGLCDISGFGGERNDFGRVGRLPRAVGGSEFADYIKARLSCGAMRAYIPENKIIEKVAVLGGAGKDFLPDAAGVADAYITADLSHNSFVDAKIFDIALFDAGHYFTENPVIYEIASRLEAAFPDAKVMTADSACPYECN